MTQLTRASDAQVTEARARMDALVQRRREETGITRAILGTMWGSSVPENVARGMARWCKAHAIDPTEVDILGGKPYLGAAYYLRRLTEIDPELLEYARADHVEKDARLAEIVARPIPEDADEATKAMALEERRWARQEHFRRLQERITHGLSDDAKAAVIYRVKLRNQAREFTGADEIVLGRKKRVRKKDGSGFFEVSADPVGDENPRKTAESRAARRCLRQVVSAFPTLSQQIQVIEADGKSVAEEIAAEEARTVLGQRPVAQLAGGEAGAGDAYDDSTGEVVDEPPRTEEEIRREGPRIKAQLANLLKVMESPVFTDDERQQAEDAWQNATYGEAEAAIRAAKEIRLAREAQLRAGDGAGVGAVELSDESPA